MYNSDNPLYEFCAAMSKHSRIHFWSVQTYQEMIDRLCYLIDRGQSISRCLFQEAVNQQREMMFVTFGGQRVPVAGKVQHSPLWGESQLIILDNDYYILNIDLEGGDGSWTFMGHPSGNSLVLRTPHINLGEEIGLSVKFFEPEPVDDEDYHKECIAHFVKTYEDASIADDLWFEYYNLRSKFGRTLDKRINKYDY